MSSILNDFSFDLYDTFDAMKKCRFDRRLFVLSSGDGGHDDVFGKDMQSFGSLPLSDEFERWRYDNLLFNSLIGRL